MSQWKKSSSTGTCPVTGGCPTRMTAATFDALCKAKRAEMRSEDSNDAHVSVRDLKNKLNICSTCRGKKRPVELEIITIEGAMATKRGLCEECGEKGLAVSMNHGVNMCSTCKTVHSNVNNRPETVIGAIKRLGMVDRYVGELVTGAVTATVDSQVLERIAAAVGYEGTDGDGLISAVEGMERSWSASIKERDSSYKLIAEVIGIMGLDCADLDNLPDETRRMMDDRNAFLAAASSPSPDVIRALGLPEGPTSWQTIELAAMQTAAELEGHMREWAGIGEWREYGIEIDRLRQLLKMTVAPIGIVVDQVEHILAALDAGNDVDADLVTANNRVEELETILCQIREAAGPITLGMDLAVAVRGLVATSHRVDELGSLLKWAEEHLDHIAEALGSKGMAHVDIAAQCRNLATMAQYVPPAPMDLRTSSRPAESYILDLALMALRGEVTGLDPDFLVVMREAV